MQAVTKIAKVDKLIAALNHFVPVKKISTESRKLSLIFVFMKNAIA